MNHRRSQANPESSSFRSAVEPLERRVMLSSVGVFRPPVAFTPTSTDVADLKNGPMANVGQQLVEIYREYRRFKRNTAADVDFVSKLRDSIVIGQDRVGVTVRGRGTLEALTQRLRDSKAQIIFRNRQYTVVQAMVPIGQLHDLARDPQIATLRPIFLPERRQQGVSDNQADFGLKADRVRTTFGLDGSGVSIGVLSDSVSRFGMGLPGSIATGDLPANVTVLADLDPFDPFSPTDEGRAMLELIHDIAPKSPLFFATGFGGMLAFADNIRALRNAGAKVIVDDLGFRDEPFFQPSVIDQAITDVTNDGAVYLSSAGNSADEGYDAPTNFVKIGRNRFVDFDPGPGVDTRLRATISAGKIQWDNPYNGVVGAASTDLDIYFYDTTYGRLITVGNENNLKTGIPQELFGVGGEVDVEIRVADFAPGAVLPTRFRMDGVIASEYEPETRSTVQGHSGGLDTISVGAVPFFLPVENEDFSSFGPVTYFFDADGNRLSAPLAIQKPDISGIDGSNTSFFGKSTFVFPGSDPDNDQLPNFFGTSAAAPNVAAIVALMLQAAPDATSADIAEALRSSAIPLNGAFAGFDPQGGFGLVDAEMAIQQFIQPPAVHVTAVKPDPRVDPIDSLKIVFSQVVLGFDIADLTLTRDGGPNLLTGAQTLEPTDAGRTWLLRDLRGLTTTPGTYTLTLDESLAAIVNTTIFQSPLANTAIETFRVIDFPEIPPAPTDLKAKIISDGVVRLRWTDNSVNEDRFIVQRAEDEDFGTKLKTFTLPADTSVFTDQLIQPVGKRVFYRVRALNDFSEFADSSNTVELFLPGAGEIILDNESSKGVQINGVWNTVSDTPGFLGESALEDLNAGKGAKNVRFTPNITQAGDYFVYARWTRDTDRATNVPYDIFSSGAPRKTVVIDQRNSGGDGWVLLGKFNFELGTGGFVRIRNDGTDGVVAVDSIRFQPAS